MPSTKTVQREISKIEQILPYLTDQLDRRVADLPDPVRTALKQVKLAPRLTTSGLEPINPIIDWLVLARSLAQDFLEGKFKLTERR